MKQQSICSTPTSKDKRIAEKYASLSDVDKKGYYVATLRGLYELEHGPQNWDAMKDEQVESILLSFRGELHQKQAREIPSLATNVGSVYLKLRNEFTAETRTNRVNMIAYEFSKLVDNILKANPNYSRNAVVNGIISEKGLKFGEVKLFARLYKDMCANMQRHYELGTEEGKRMATQYAKILDNWEALVTLTRIKLRDTEGLVLNGKGEKVDDTDPSNFEDINIEDIFDVEEATREGWQEIVESMSAYANISQELRRMIGRMPDNNKYGVKLDDMGSPMFLDPVRVHQLLLRKARGSKDVNEMIKKIQDAYREGNTSLGSLIELLTPTIDIPVGVDMAALSEAKAKGLRLEDCIIYERGIRVENLEAIEARLQQAKRSLMAAKVSASRADYLLAPAYQKIKERAALGPKLWNNLHLNFSKLTALGVAKDRIEGLREGVKKYTTRLLNKFNNLDMIEAVKSNILLGKVLDERSSIYNRDESVNGSNMKIVSEVITKITEEKEGDKKIDIVVNNRESNPEEYKKYIRNITAVLRGLGIPCNDEVVANMINDRRDRDRFITALRNFNTYGMSVYLKLFNSDPNIMAREIVTYAKHTERGGSIVPFEIFIKEATALMVKHDSSLSLESRVPYMDRHGKNTTFSSDVKPSFLGDRMEAIQAMVEKGGNHLKRYLEKEYFTCPIYATKKSDGGYTIHNVWLRELYESDLSDPNSFANQFTWDRFLGDEKKEGNKRFENYSLKQHAISILQKFIGKSETNRDEVKNYADYPVFILGDSGVSKYITSKIYTMEELKKNLLSVYRQELIRARLAYEANKTLIAMNQEPIDNFCKSWNKFTSMPFLNDIFEIKAVEEKEEIEGSILTSTKIMVVRKGTNDQVYKDEEIWDVIKSSFDSGFNKFRSVLKKNGVEATIEANDGSDTSLQYEHLQNFLNTGEKNDVFKNGDLNSNLELFYYNTRFATMQQMQLMTVDVGFYKGVEDLQKRYKEIHAPGNTLDITAWDPYNHTFYSKDGIERVVYFDDITIDAEEVNKEFMRALESRFADKPDVIAAYRANTLTDGQGYRSLSSYRKVLGMAGEWTDKMEEVYNEIRNIRTKGTLSKEDIDRLQELAMVFQPLKPYMYTHESINVNTNGEKLLVPVQHKYAEIVLIPELLPEGSSLRKLATYMENKDIDMVGSTKIVKVGGFGATVCDYRINNEGLYIDKEGNVIPVIDKNGKKITSGITRKMQRGDVTRGEGSSEYKQYELFKSLATPLKETGDFEEALAHGYVHELKYSDYRIQSNVPEHVHHSTLFGTQVRKLIMSGLDMGSDKYASYIMGKDGNPAEVNLGPKMGKSTLNGKRLLSFYNELITANILDSYREFEQAINNIDAVSARLIQNVISNSREAQDNIVAYSLTGDSKFLVPLFEGTLEHDAASALLSVFKKKVNKQHIAGGAAVQASAWGINKVEEGPDSGGLIYHTNKSKTNITYVDCEIPFILSYKDVNGKEYSLDYNEFCDLDGNLLLTGRKIDVATHRVLTTAEEIAEAEEKGTLADETKIEQKFPGILDIIAYRIPTESNYSMINLRVKRFSKPTEGGTIKVPAQGTTSAGFDFDIDKLYLMRKEFKMRKITKEEAKKIWKKIFADKSNGIEEALRSVGWGSKESEEEKAVQDFIDGIFSSIFTDNEALSEEMLAARARSRKMSSYWQAAGLPGTPHDAFIGYVEDHMATYLEDYDVDLPVISGTHEGEAIKGNSRISRNNMLIHLIRQRLMDSETFVSRYTPGGFAAPSASARLIRELRFGGYIETGRTVEIQNTAYDRETVSATKDKIFLYSENLEEEEAYRTNTNRNLPIGSQAVVRGLPNTVGIILRKTGGTDLNGFYTDSEFESFKGHLDASLKAARSHNKNVVIPSDSEGNFLLTGLSEFKTIAPRCYDYLMQSLTELYEEAPAADYSKFDYEEVKRNAASKDRKDPKPEYDYSDPATILLFNQQNQVAGKLIGIFANQNINHALASLVESYTLVQPIAFGDHSEVGLSDLIHNPLAKQTTAEFLAASVDAVKDPVLNDLLFNEVTANSGAMLARLGYSTNEIGLLFNQPVIRFLCRYVADHNCSVDDAIKAAKNYYKIGRNRVSKTDLSCRRLAFNVAVAETGSSTLYSQEFIECQADVLNLFSNIYSVASEVNEFVTNTKFTASNAVKSTFGGMYAQQIKVKEYIKKVKSGSVHTLIQVRPGAQAVISNNSEETNIPDNYVPLQTSNGRGMSDFDYLYSQSENPFAYEQAMYDMNKRAVEALNKSLFPYETPLYKGMRELLNEISNYGLDEDIINAAHSDMLTYAISKIPGSKFNGITVLNKSYEVGDTPTAISALDYYSNIFPKKLANFIKDIKGLKIKSKPNRANIVKNLFERIEFTTTEHTDGSTSISFNIKNVGLQASQIDEIREAWESLYMSNDKEMRELAEDLFFYNFYKSGFSYGPTSYGILAPSMLKASLSMGYRSSLDDQGNTVIKEVSYRSFLNSLQEGRLFLSNREEVIEDFIRQFIQNHSNNSRIVTQYENDSKYGYKEVVDLAAYKDDKNRTVYRDSFEATAKTSKDAKNILCTANEDGSFTFKAAIKVNGQLYIAEGGEYEGKPFNVSSGSMTYVKVPVRNEMAYNFEKTKVEGVSFDGVEETLFDPNVAIEKSADEGSLLDDTRISEDDNTTYVGSDLERSIIKSMDPEIAEAYAKLPDSTKEELLDMLNNDELVTIEVDDDGNTVISKLC